MHWHVMTCPPNRETKAESFLAIRFTDVFVPRQIVYHRRRLRSGRGVNTVERIEKREVPLLGRYICLRADPAALFAALHESRARGLDVLSGILYGPDGLAVVPDDQIDAVRSMDGREIGRPQPYRKGDRVRIRVASLGEVEARLTDVQVSKARALMRWFGTLREVTVSPSEIVGAAA